MVEPFLSTSLFSYTEGKLFIDYNMLHRRLGLGVFSAISWNRECNNIECNKYAPSSARHQKPSTPKNKLWVRTTNNT